MGYRKKAALWSSIAHHSAQWGVLCLHKMPPNSCTLVLFPTIMKKLKLLKFILLKIKFIIYIEPSVLTLQLHQYPRKRVIAGNSFGQIGFEVSDTCALLQIYPIFKTSSHSPNYYTSAFMGLYERREENKGESKVLSPLLPELHARDCPLIPCLFIPASMNDSTRQTDFWEEWNFHHRRNAALLKCSQLLCILITHRFPVWGIGPLPPQH